MTEEMTVVKLKVRPIGTSLGVILPKEILEQLNVGKDDVLFLTRDESGYRVTPYDPEVEEQVRLGEEFMKQYRDTFRALAK